MKNSSIIAKATSIVVSLMIIFIFIIPKFESIKEIQDNVASYNDQIDNINLVNEQLRLRTNELKAIEGPDRSDLLTFLPDEVDTLTVVRTLENIINMNGLQASNISYSQSSQADDSPVELHTFQIEATGSYGQITSFFSQLEQNEYLFDVTSTQFSVEEGGAISLSAEFVTYSLMPDII